MHADQKIFIMCHFLETRKYRRLRQRLLKLSVMSTTERNIFLIITRIVVIAIK